MEERKGGSGFSDQHSEGSIAKEQGEFPFLMLRQLER